MSFSSIIWNSMNTDLKGGVFGASIIMTGLCGVFLVSRIALWVFFGISLLSTLVTYYMIFVKKKR